MAQGNDPHPSWLCFIQQLTQDKSPPTRGTTLLLAALGMDSLSCCAGIYRQLCPARQCQIHSSE